MTHQTAPLSTARDDDAPLPKQAKAAAGMVDGKALDTARQDAASGNTTTTGKVPHQGEAMVHLAGRAGLAVVAGQDLQVANGQSLSLSSCQDSNVAVGGQARLHAGQAIGMVAGLSKAGKGNVGLQLTAGQDDIDVQAQHDLLKLAARDDLTIVSANMNVDFAGAKRICIATAGGASITIEGGNTLGPVTEWDRGVMVREIEKKQEKYNLLAKRRELTGNLDQRDRIEIQMSALALNNFEKRVLAACGRKQACDFPVMEDSDAGDLRDYAGLKTSIAVRWLVGSNTRREPHGHARYRRVFDKS